MVPFTTQFAATQFANKYVEAPASLLVYNPHYDVVDVWTVGGDGMTFVRDWVGTIARSL